ncbi:MAG: glycosyltransferase family 9 protein [Bacteroidia bacterium]
MPKILIIRFSSIGDIVLTTPVIRCLKQQLKDAEIHFLTKNNFRDVLKNNPYIHKIHSIEKNSSEIIEELKKENFDFIIDLHHNLRSFEIKRHLKKKSFSFDKLNLQKWLLVNLKINFLPPIHIVDRYLKTVKKLGVKNDGKGLDYFIADEDKISLSSLPGSHQKGFIAFVIGAKHFTKRLPIEKIISICKKINQPIILLGGKEDAEKAAIIEKSNEKLIFSACGKYSIAQSASLIQQANAVITHDTGLMHIAAAFRKRIFSVWGNTVPAFGMSPYMPVNGSKIVEVQNLSCRPCSKIGYEKCPKKHFKCMMDIDESIFLEL